MSRRMLAAAAALAAGAAAIFYFVEADRYAGFQGEVFVDIPRGTSTPRIAAMLADAGVVRHPLLFLAARAVHPRLRPLAGEYRFVEPAAPAEILRRLARGDVYTIELRVPEGTDVYDLAQLVEAAGLGSARDFLRVALPHEGYLFPSTYFFRRRTTPEQIVETMRAQFEKVWRELGGPEERKRETVILASLVEAEAARDEERARIARVFLNRLRKGMRLECDPTVKYAAKREGRWRGTIYRSDLESRNRYNTYVWYGLPPGPITNPGRASLEAALRPAETSDLYFVARPRGNGEHVFSADYESHQKAVREYRRGQNHAKAARGNSGLAPQPGRKPR
ncbi:MAG: endolytic transglycosylase MltG [Bryobacteraceae bacterium]|nr:endolytic transglycosylase MltG [Bryobacteraceae bacterium]